MHSREVLSLAENALADVKAREVRVMDVRKLTTVTDYMIIASGTSDRHVRSIADRLVEKATTAGEPPLGTAPPHEPVHRVTVGGTHGTPVRRDPSPVRGVVCDLAEAIRAALVPEPFSDEVAQGG